MQKLIMLVVRALFG